MSPVISVDLNDASQRPDAVDARSTVRVRRERLSREALRTAGWDLGLLGGVASQAAAEDRFASRLGAPAGRSGAEANSDRRREAAGEQSPDAVLDELARAGLVEHGGATPVGDSLLAVWSAAALSVHLTLRLIDRGQQQVLRVRHCLPPGQLPDGLGSVVSLASADGQTYELAVFEAASWRTELARAVRVAQVSHAEPELPAQLIVPWDALLISGPARRAGRSDVLHSLRAAHSSTVATWLDRLETGARGTLRIEVCRRDQPAVAVRWLTLDVAGWWRLTPVEPIEASAQGEDGVPPSVRFDRIGADDVASDVAELIGQVLS